MIRDFGLRGFEFWGFRDLGFRALVFRGLGFWICVSGILEFWIYLKDHMTLKEGTLYNYTMNPYKVYEP